MYINYFFIPANKPKFIKKSNDIEGIDHRVFDLEDSVLDKDVESSISLLKEVPNRRSDWIRIPLYDKNFAHIIKNCLEIGYQNFIIPKFASRDELLYYVSKIKELCNDFKLILLVEHPKALIELENILSQIHEYLHGIGLGSQDFCHLTGIKNDINYLRQIRLKLLILAKAYNIEAIDVVSMNISDEVTFKEDIIEGFNCGYRAKFLIHPFQLQVLRSIPFYSFEEVEKYNKILSYYENNIKGNDALFSFEGDVYEKMHIVQIKKIVSWGAHFYGTNR